MLQQQQSNLQRQEEEGLQQQLQQQRQQKIKDRLNQKLVDNIKLNPPEENDRLVIEGFDFSLAFHNFKTSLLNFECPITLENHVQQAL